MKIGKTKLVPLPPPPVCDHVGCDIREEATNWYHGASNEGVPAWEYRWIYRFCDCCGGLLPPARYEERRV